MKYQVDVKNSIAVFTLEGPYLDASNSKDFKSEVIPEVQKYDKVAFDFVNVRFVDSSGLGALLSCMRTVRSANGRVVIFGLSQSVRALFELVRMHRIFEIFNNEDEVVRAFDSVEENVVA